MLLDHLRNHGNSEIAIRLNDTSLSLRGLEDLLACKEKTQHLMQKNNEALLQYVEDMKALRNLILNDLSSDSINSFIQ